MGNILKPIVIVQEIIPFLQVFKRW